MSRMKGRVTRTNTFSEEIGTGRAAADWPSSFQQPDLASGLFDMQIPNASFSPLMHGIGSSSRTTACVELIDSIADTTLYCSEKKKMWKKKLLKVCSSCAIL